VLVVDKPPGMTSHDVVQRLRRALGERRVGHAGTLDPAATGVLVAMVGEATKLGPYLTAEDKAYEATLRFGSATDTLDADGEVVASAPLPPWWSAVEADATLERALEMERQRSSQIPPSYSAIKIDGRPAHARARAGEVLDLEPRAVAVRRLEVTSREVARGTLSLSMTVAKGYYVRSLARDLCHTLGLQGHLSELRRSASGAFTLAEAVALEPLDGPRLTLALMPLSVAARRALPAARLTEEGALRARHGGPMQPEHFAEPAPLGLGAWLDPAGALVAVGEAAADRLQVLRGFEQ
jgi:tRNA pseudouridine55 synthase